MQQIEGWVVVLLLGGDYFNLLLNQMRHGKHLVDDLVSVLYASIPCVVI
jgi:hypothetical protein